MNADDELGASLDLLGRRRVPYAEVLAAIAGDVLARFPPLPGRSLLELGAGAGQLRGLLPADLRARMLHSEPSPAAARALRARAGGAAVVRATAEALPVAAGACGAVVGLCVMDAVAERGRDSRRARARARAGRALRAPARHGDAARAAVREARRLTAGADPERVRRSGRSRMAARHRAAEARLARGPAALRDGAGHPFAATFTPIFAPFLVEAPSFDVVTATNAFKAIAGSGERRRTLAALLTSAAATGGRARPPAGRAPALSTPARYLQSGSQTSFGTAAGFAVELSEIVATRGAPPRRRRRERNPLPEPVPRPRAAGGRVAPPVADGRARDAARRGDSRRSRCLCLRRAEA